MADVRGIGSEHGMTCRGIAENGEVLDVERKRLAECVQRMSDKNAADFKAYMSRGGDDSAVMTKINDEGGEIGRLMAGLMARDLPTIEAVRRRCGQTNLIG